jgi:hypothetical protein
MKKTIEQLESELPAIVRHAHETRRFALLNGHDSLTVGDIGRMIRLLYGDAVADALDAHIKARIDSVLP